MIPIDPQRPTSRHPLRLLGCLVFSLILLALTGCNTVWSSNSEEPGSPEPTASPEVTPTGSGVPGNLDSSVALIRSAAEPDDVLGSAVVIASDGLLVTAIDALHDDIEVVLPDGTAHRPALVSMEPDAGLALLRIPAERLVPARVSTARPSPGTEVFATGYDGTPGTLGRMSGEVTTSVESEAGLEYRVRGALFIETDINLVRGFLGGALSGGEGELSGILVPDESGDGETMRATTHWFVMAWLESRQSRLDDLAAEATEWEATELPGGWTMRRPDNWSETVSAESEDAYRAELTPADPDVPLQLAISVEPNRYGTDADEFISEVFEDRGSARIWSVSRVNGRPLVRVTMSEEGALVDVGYLLDETHLIAVSLRSGYQPLEDHVQVDEARALFETVMESIQAP